MTPEAKEALEGSIRKWAKIVAGEGIDDGSDNCPLCEAFQEETCHGCPVQAKSGQDYCKGTPYMAWHRHHEKQHGNEYAPYAPHHGCPACRREAQAELDFLISLREPDNE